MNRSIQYFNLVNLTFLDIKSHLIRKKELYIINVLYINLLESSKGLGNT